MEHKRGDSFDYTTTLPETFPDGYFVGWSVSAQVRAAGSGALIAQLACSWEDAATTRSMRLLAVDTTSWPVGLAHFDIQFRRASDGYVLSTATEPLNVTRDCTQ